MNAFRYVQGVGGMCQETDYPYLAYVSLQYISSLCPCTYISSQMWAYDIKYLDYIRNPMPCV